MFLSLLFCHSVFGETVLKIKLVFTTVYLHLSPRFLPQSDSIVISLDKVHMARSISESHIPRSISLTLVNAALLLATEKGGVWKYVYFQSLVFQVFLCSGPPQYFLRNMMVM